jgi:hypothetical protein
MKEWIELHRARASDYRGDLALLLESRDFVAAAPIKSPREPRGRVRRSAVTRAGNE